MKVKLLIHHKKRLSSKLLYGKLDIIARKTEITHGNN